MNTGNKRKPFLGKMSLEIIGLNMCRHTKNLLKCTTKIITPYKYSPAIHPQRLLSIITAKTFEWNQVVSDAEKIVGYPTSFMYLRCLLSDEIADVAVHVRKLIGTKHPLLKTARGLVYSDKNSIQIRGLIVLLMSKAAMSEHLPEQPSDADTCGIQDRQRTLAEITDMIHTAYLIHKGVVNIRDVTPNDGPLTDMEFGNKISVLSGDFLLANACTGLAKLQNTKVVEMISSGIGDLMEAEFTYDTASTHSATVEEWSRHTYLSSCSLLAKSCQSTLLLTNHSQELQKSAHDFGLNIAYALQVFSALHGTSDVNHFSHLLQDISHLVTEYSQRAKLALETFTDSDAKTALVNVADALTIDNSEIVSCGT